MLGCQLLRVRTLVQIWGGMWECRVCIVCSDAVSSDYDGVPSWLWRLFSAVMGEQFLMYMEAFKPFLHLALKNTEEHTVRVYTATCTFSYMPWLHELALSHQIALSIVVILRDLFDRSINTSGTVASR